MAINKVDWPTASTPSYTPSISTDYNNQNENIERSAKGVDSVSLTDWDDTTTAPEVASGSVIEANGSFWDVTTDTVISTTGASSGDVYLVFDESVPEFKWTSTAPTWSASLNGWYVSGDRFTGHVCAWDGSTAFSEKRKQSNDQNGDSVGSSALGVFAGNGVYSDNASVKFKKFEGTLDGGGNVDITHGLDITKVLGANFLAKSSANSAWYANLSASAGAQLLFFLSDNVTLRLVMGSSSFFSQPYKVIVWYEA